MVYLQFLQNSCTIIFIYFYSQGALVTSLPLSSSLLLPILSLWAMWMWHAAVSASEASEAAVGIMGAEAIVDKAMGGKFPESQIELTMES